MNTLEFEPHWTRIIITGIVVVVFVLVLGWAMWKSEKEGIIPRVYVGPDDEEAEKEFAERHQKSMKATKKMINSKWRYNLIIFLFFTVMVSFVIYYAYLLRR